MSMTVEGIERNCCPKCGGVIIISDLFQYSHNHKVLKSGKVSKKYIRRDEGPMEVSIASCEDCGNYWGEDNFRIIDDKFIDCKYYEENEYDGE